MLLVGVALATTYGVFFMAAMGVAARARETRVPDVAGRPVTDAEAMLAAAGLELARDPIKRPDLTVPENHVLTQDPVAGTTLKRGRTVRVRLSDGARLPTLPDLLGTTESDARARAAAAHVSVDAIAELASGRFAANAVLAQDPPARTLGRTVGLLVNRGATGITYVMPDLIGAPEGRALDLLRARGFRAAVTGYAAYPGLPGGVIIRQSPQSGFQIAPGEAISLEVSR